MQPLFHVSVGSDFWPGTYQLKTENIGAMGHPTMMENLPHRFVILDCSTADAWRFAWQLTCERSTVLSFLRNLRFRLGLV